MRFSQPLVLLLGSVLSASGIGCSAISAIVTDSRPVHRENRSDTDRITAIGRVFENQGRYDKAEAMYRRALKSRPQDPELRSQLQQLADRRKEKSFGPATTAKAIAVADAISPPKPMTREAQTQPLAQPVAPAHQIPSPTAALQAESRVVHNDAPADEMIPEIAFVPSANSADNYGTPGVETGPVILNSSHASTATNAGRDIALTSGSQNGWRKSKEHTIDSEIVLVALESPDQHVSLLLEALDGGDSDATKALAATLLGDCDPANTEVRNALHQHLKSQQSPEVLLALCDSQIERHEADGQTLSGLFNLCSLGDADIQIQAASQLRNFAGSEFESSCLTALSRLLTSPDTNVRATAVITLGDFSSLDENTIPLLQDLAARDPDAGVREAAEATLARRVALPLQAVPRIQ